MTITILDLFGSSGGVGRCTKEKLRQFEMEGVTTILCGQSHVVDSFRSETKAAPYLELANLERPKFSVGSLKIKLASRTKADSPRLANALLEETVKATAARNGRCAQSILVNYPQIIAPPTSTHSFCLFVHDLNWRPYPGNFSDPTRTDKNCHGWVDRAVKVITNSECTRDEVIEHYQCAPSKVVAAPLAPFAGEISEDFAAAKYLASLGLMADHFYLFPGVWGLHKGHETLTNAIAASNSNEPVVVTCGMPRKGIAGTTPALANLRNSLASRWDKLIQMGKLVVVGGISEFEMQALRLGCKAYVIPSLYEGFGFPLVEAIYHHRPAIVSDIKAHQEILKRYPQYKLARLVSPGASRELVTELNRASTTHAPMPEAWRQKIETAWSWKHNVRTILETLQSSTASKGDHKLVI